MLTWYGHVRRIPGERIAEKVYQTDVLGELDKGDHPCHGGKVEQYRTYYVTERVGGDVRFGSG